MTYIKDWDKAVKYAADAGLLVQTALMVTGSDLAFIRDARMRFPGRRGAADRVDFHLHPLSLRELLTLEGRVLDLDIHLDNPQPMPDSVVEAIYRAFSRYLLHGGYLTAINDLAEFGTIRRATFATYFDWIRGDVLKRGRYEAYLRDGRFWPVEIKWTRSLRRKALKQIARYDNGETWTLDQREGRIGGTRSLPLSIQLLRVGA